MEKLHIAVDHDDVMLQLCAGLSKSINLERGLDTKPEDFANNQHGRAFVKELGLGKYDDLDSWFAKHAWVWATYDAVVGAIGGVEQLRADGHMVELITKKPEWGEWVVWKWLSLWRPPFHKVTITPLHANKAHWTDADILIDDSDTQVKEWHDAGRAAIIFDQPWNTHLQTAPLGGLFRAKGWKDIPKCIEMLDQIKNGPGKVDYMIGAN